MSNASAVPSRGTPFDDDVRIDCGDARRRSERGCRRARDLAEPCQIPQACRFVEHQAGHHWRGGGDDLCQREEPQG